MNIYIGRFCDTCELLLQFNFPLGIIQSINQSINQSIDLSIPNSRAQVTQAKIYLLLGIEELCSCVKLCCGISQTILEASKQPHENLIMTFSDVECGSLKCLDETGYLYLFT